MIDQINMLPPISRAQAYLDCREYWTQESVENRFFEVNTTGVPHRHRKSIRLGWGMLLLLATIVLH